MQPNPHLAAYIRDIMRERMSAAERKIMRRVAAQFERGSDPDLDELLAAEQIMTRTVERMRPVLQ